VFIAIVVGIVIIRIVAKGSDAVELVARCVLDPIGALAGAGVDAGEILRAASDSPRDDTDVDIHNRTIASSGSLDEGTSRVLLAGILSAFSRAQHHLRDLSVVAIGPVTDIVVHVGNRDVLENVLEIPFRLVAAKSHHNQIIVRGRHRIVLVDLERDDGCRCRCWSCCCCCSDFCISFVEAFDDFESNGLVELAKRKIVVGFCSLTMKATGSVQRIGDPNITKAGMTISGGTPFIVAVQAVLVHAAN